MASKIDSRSWLLLVTELVAQQFPKWAHLEGVLKRKKGYDEVS